MKKCQYCGKEYPDGTVACAVDGYPLDGAEQETAPVTDKSPSAGFGIRLLARIIDWVFRYFIGFAAAILAAIVLTILGTSGVIAPGWQERLQDAGFAVVLFGILGDIAYHSFCEGIHGATLGKLCCGICVVTKDFKPSNLKGATIRSLGFLLDAMFFGLIGYNSMSGSPLNQRYGDVWGKTVVVKVKKLSPESRRSSTRFIVGLLVGAGCDLVIVAAILVLQVSL
jgi:uncharacterized RDD family membrane protein YckC